MDSIEQLLACEPQLVWKYFREISRIPRCSKKEAKIREYVLGVASTLSLEARTDKAGNIVIVRPASPGKENRPIVALQGHLDMVCEKNVDTQHDFEKNGIEWEVDGEWLRARGTTLGADNGIAVAYMLALLESDHELGEIECLFTTDEESGLTGALALDPDILRARTLINLDSEEEGYVCIGCAGGQNTYGSIPVVWQSCSSDHLARRLEVRGLTGGHSGMEIDKQLANSLVIGARILDEMLKSPGILLGELFGGDKHNAIPREFTATLAGPPATMKTLDALVQTWNHRLRDEFATTDPNLSLHLAPVDTPQQVLVPTSARTIVDALLALPHGILGMSREVDGLVETSSNVANIRTNKGEVTILTSQRSSREALIEWATEKNVAVLRLAGGSARLAERYPAWTPDRESRLLATARRVYREWRGNDPHVVAFHAGLECGVIGAKIGDIDMISFGPDMEGVHTPGERLKIGSTANTWEFLIRLLQGIE